MTETKIALFFGAGAEIAYGLPSGGKFALDLFRTSVEADKQAFRAQLERIDNTSSYATKWLPDNYRQKRIHVFGRSDFEGIVASSMEYRREEILGYLERFDACTSGLLTRWTLSEETVRRRYREEHGAEIGDITYGQAIRLNSRLAESVRLFESDYFSAMLKTLEAHPGHRGLHRAVRALLELLVGACGQRLVARLNEELFEEAPEQLSVFDDLAGIFSLDYRQAGQTGLEIALEQQNLLLTADSPLPDIMAELGRALLEDLFARVLDYQALIDSHFRYLYNPRAHWAKFTRIAIFLHTVRRYIGEHGGLDPHKLAHGPGFYHDLVPLAKRAGIQAIGTTNYNHFVQRVLDSFVLPDIPVYHLNGSVSEHYDPYCNAIMNEADTEAEAPAAGRHLTVPFLFTQSGVKPLTSIAMSRRYVELYDKFRQADAICMLGYGFNGDDGHINGLFRSLALEGKRLIIYHYGNGHEAVLRREYQSKLRLPSPDLLHVFAIDAERQSGGCIWWERALREIVPAGTTI